jgi:ABC-2 type transport system permease protein
MTATALRPAAPAADVRSPGASLAGTGTLVRFILRRDRVKLPAWLLGATGLLYYFGMALPEVFATEEQLRDIGRFMDGAMGAMFGPGYGRDAISVEVYIANVYALFFFIIAALMSLQLVARHTRVDEQHARAELVRSNVVGRHAQLTATLVVALVANVLLALLLGGAMAANGYDGGQGLLFGAGVGAVGLVFAGVAAVTVQVTEYARSATGAAGAVLGTAWLVRAAGDLAGDHGSALSWFSPLAWSNQTRPYVDGRWWPLLLSLGLASVAATVGYVLSSRRDVGAGLFAAQGGQPVAASWLRSPLAVAFRLQRTSLLWWTGGLATFGFILGGVGDQIADPADMSEERIEMFGGSVDTLLDGFLGIITMLTAVLAGIMVVRSVQAVRSEETEGRAEPLLATATGRDIWLGTHLAVTALGLVGMMLVVGLATGIGAGLSVGDGGYVGAVAVAHLAHVPGVLVLLGLAAALFGLLPRAIGVTWIVLAIGLFSGLFGAMMELPQWLRNLSPMEHTGQPPLDDVAWSAAAILLVLATVLVGAGLAGFGRRDLETT